MTIGKSVKRVDAVAKVTGRARYTDDFYMPGMLVAKYLRSTIAHGRVKKMDTRKARQVPGVEAVFTYKDVPKTKFATAGHPYSLDPAHKDVADRLLLTEHIRYWGDEIAIVVAENNIVL
ncbi:MAG: xanthine dehydrogenase molybdenum-binding subunit XdhA, partial [Deltaproteobacteria bacterium]|nr:xanthine dehydrogenase molybdenum-binding subunit XdhA [Deltaproteobacteria bacterium]